MRVAVDSLFEADLSLGSVFYYKLISYLVRYSELTEHSATEQVEIEKYQSKRLLSHSKKPFVLDKEEEKLWYSIEEELGLVLW